LLETRSTRAVTTIILSAIGSSNSPSLDCCFSNLAKKPSKKSVKLASTKIEKDSQLPKLPGRKNANTRKGTKINRPIVRILGILKIIKNSY
jgi:hypothetical protein